MKYKIILALSLTAMLSLGVMLTGCGNNNTTDNGNTANTTDNGNTANNKLHESVNEAGEAVKDGVEGIGNAIKYTAIDVKNDISKAGRNLKESVDTKKDYFTDATETDYVSEDGELIRVYEFKNSADADAAINKISSDGLTIDGNTIYSTKPHYYRKGDTIVIYEGKNDAYITEFNTLYGNPLI